MAKYSEYEYGFAVAHLIVPTGKIFYNRGPIDEQFPIINGPVQLGVDESTTQTGICVADMKGNPLMLIDLVNLSLPKAEVYLTLLKRWVHYVLPKMDVRRIIYEEINQNAPQKYARKRLMQVANIFEDYVNEAETDIELVCINNKTWKKHLLASPEYDGQRVKTELVKAAVKKEVYNHIPTMCDYRFVYQNGDSCDAYGIVYGYKKECFIDEACKERKVNSTIKNTPLRKYSSRYVDLPDLRKQVTEGKISNFKKFKKLRYNADLTLEDNCLRSINYNPAGVILYGLNIEKVKNMLCFDANRDISENTVLLVWHVVS